ncbi:hypothetical protein F4819DRAFT_510312 [Hypoxylon fuscum]|nr:hypothetical protein F4819DRAFT_510312 [Hypoxylon fuscum]
MSAALAHLGVQYMPATGGCMLDMAAMPTNLFDACSAIHIRMPENQHIDVNADMICIKPTQPNPNFGSYREQYFYPNVVASPPADLPQETPKQQQQQQENLPSFEAPQSAPSDAGGDEPWKAAASPEVPAPNHDEPSPAETAADVRPAQATAPTSTCTSTGHVTSTFLTRVLQSSQAPFSPEQVITTTVVSSIERGHLSTFVITATPTASPEPEEPVHIDAPPAPTPEPPVPVPELPQVPEPEPAVIPHPPHLVHPHHPHHPHPHPHPHPHHPLPHPHPQWCDAGYFKMDVTTIRTLDPHDMWQYLELLGIGKTAPGAGAGAGPDMAHGIAAFVDALLGGAVDDDETRVLRKELEHAYRVRCGVPLPGPAPFPAFDRTFAAASRTECLEACEKHAIGFARDRQVRECLGAAWHPRLGRDNCRFWTGERDAFLPVDRIREEEGEWELVYL